MYEIKILDSKLLEKYEDKLRELHNEGYKLYFPDVQVLAAQQVLAAHIMEKFASMLRFSREDSVLMLGILYRENLVGYLWAFYREVISEKTGHLEKIGHLNDIFIEKDHRKKGMGKKLINKMEGFMLENNVTAIDLYVTSSKNDLVALYERIGFEVVKLNMMKKI